MESQLDAGEPLGRGLRGVKAAVLLGVEDEEKDEGKEG